MKAKTQVREMKDKDQIFNLGHPNGSSLGAWVSTQEEVNEAVKGFKCRKQNGVKIYDKSDETVIVDAGTKNVILYAEMNKQVVKVILDNRKISIFNKAVEIVDKAGNLLKKTSLKEMLGKGEDK